MRDKTQNLIDAAREVLAEYNPMTLRQVYYQLVSRHVIDNNRNEYQRLGRALVKGRQDSQIPWEWIEDRGRKPRVPSAWGGLADFLDTVRRSYRRDIWPAQPCFTIVWVEKDALSGIFEDITHGYGVPLMIGRGYNSWSALHDVAERIREMHRPTTILYYGDFDPSGEDIVRALDEGLQFFGIQPNVAKVSLTKVDVEEYNLPPDFTKKTDSRSKAFVERYGDMAVELDALPMPVLREKIRTAIEANLDMTQLEIVREVQAEESEQLVAIIG